MARLKTQFCLKLHKICNTIIQSWFLLHVEFCKVVHTGDDIGHFLKLITKLYHLLNRIDTNCWITGGILFKKNYILPRDFLWCGDSMSTVVWPL